MIVSWNWLKQYVLLDMKAAELESRLMMAGLNHESTEEVGGDLAIDLEVTSNRPDCLGHLGIAREISVLWGRELKEPPARPAEGSTPVSDLTSVTIECPELCPRYTARVVRNVKVGPSPSWLSSRLATLGIGSINNVVDITNYVLMECGQPLHAFDFDLLEGKRIIVREPKPGERLEAIDHKTYDLAPGMCIIADARRPVGIGGVMGGASTEVSEKTLNLLIEAAQFDPAAIRATARRLNLHSDSSYRFERGLDPERVDWASRRCCELILELAGGDLAAGVIDVGQPPTPRAPIVLRFSQLKRILGIDVPVDEVVRILTALGNRPRRQDDREIEVIPPSWRLDLSREIDLVEEVARIHGYDEIPEDVSVPMAASARRDVDRVLSHVRHVMTAAGFDEAMTLSTVDESWSDAFSPWTDAVPLRALTPVLRRADHLRRSLVPSLLGARRINETLSNPRIELFEVAKVYLPRAGSLPQEELMLALTSGNPLVDPQRRSSDVKGVLEALLAELNVADEIEVRPFEHPLLADGRGAELYLAGERFGVAGELSPAGLKQFDLRGSTTVAEVKVDVLVRLATLVPQYAPIVPFPAIARDLNLVVPEEVRWVQIAEQVRQRSSGLLESLEYKETYRDPQRLGAGKKSILFSVSFRDETTTMTNETADRLRDEIVAACSKQFGAELRA